MYNTMIEIIIRLFFIILCGTANGGALPASGEPEVPCNIGEIKCGQICFSPGGGATCYNGQTLCRVGQGICGNNCYDSNEEICFKILNNGLVLKKTSIYVTPGPGVLDGSGEKLDRIGPFGPVMGTISSDEKSCKTGYAHNANGDCQRVLHLKSGDFENSDESLGE